MARSKQIAWISWMEFKKAMRSKAYVIQFFVLPIIIWLVVFGFNYAERNKVGYAGETFYILNDDPGVDEINLGSLLEDILNAQTETETSQLFDTTISRIAYEPNDHGDLLNFVRKNKFSPFIYIPQNFTQAYLDYGDTGIPSMVDVFTMPMDGEFGSVVSNTVGLILRSYPFTEIQLNKGLMYNMDQIAIEDVELEDTSNQYLTSFVVTYLSVFAPTFFVAHSFSSEREKHTMEAMLSLPIRRSDFILGKIGGGGLMAAGYTGMAILSMATTGLLVNSDWGQQEGLSKMTVDARSIISYMLMTFLIMMVAISLGMTLVSGIKDKKAAEQMYTFVITIPSAIIPIMMDITQAEGKLGLIHLLPWAHTYSMMNKLMYPITYSSITVTGSINTDLIFHVASLLLMVVLSILLAAWRFERRKEFDE
ncbi:MAG: ABC transporter permease [Candidatus Heimdallarchaeota archaeon]|nr:ABC transporter permease [Candidatus Heimdallarchaeota archaeon]